MDNSITNVATILHKKKYLPLSIFCITSSLATLMLPSTLYAQECISGAADIGVSNVCGNMGWTSTTITHPFGGGSLNYFSPIANNSGNYTFTMQGGDLANNLILGLNDSGSNNILILNSDTEIKINKLAISAGGANNNSSLSGNKVYIGYKDQGINESDNIINVESSLGASLNEAISGASAFGAGEVSNNVAYISSKVSAISVIGGLSLGGNIKNNSVIMNGGKVTTVYGGLTSIGVATGNFTIINNGNVTKAFGAASTYGEVKNNFLTINEGNVVKAYGGSSISSHATNNTVTINGGIVSEINGGFIDNDLTSSNPAVSLGSATGNSVIINGGTLRGTIYGGNSLKSKTGFATGNFVTIGGTNALDMSEVTQLRGGNAHNTQDGRTGNSLEISRNIVMNTATSEVSNFNTYSFQITDAYNANSPFLTANNINLGTNAIIDIDWEGVAPSQGDIIPLWTAIT